MFEGLDVDLCDSWVVPPSNCAAPTALNNSPVCQV